MGLWDALKGQLIDIVEWVEETPGVLVHRFDRRNNEIKNGAKLVVRPGQKAVFVNEGQIADMFMPGTYSLTTANLPILTTLLSLPYGFKSWHKAEVYFIKTTEQLDRKWGTPQPVTVRDPDFDMIRLRAFGNYAYKIGETNDMISRFVGARSEYRAEEFEAQIGSKVVSELSDSLGELKIPALDLPAKYNEIGERVKLNLNESLASLGIVVTIFTVTSINLPDNVNEAIDKGGAASAMAKKVGIWQQMQAADAMRDAAKNQGGAGAVMGMMMGGQMAGMVNQNMYQQQPMQPAYQQPPAAPAMPPPPPAAPTFYVAQNGQRLGPFDMAALQGMAMNGSLTPATMVWTAGMANWQAASTVAALATIFGAVPPPPPPPMP
ncbi:MAG: SPFH domain-containing protein [Victivallales bacterium]|nr:SPFH domain-containing protein [Victivallales bacterium]